MRRLLAPAVAALGLAFASPALAVSPKAPTSKPVANQGIVNIYTTLGFEDASAAGTGMIVSPGGLVYTNNHVIRGATVLSAVDVLTHKRYTATVVGYDVYDDVAVLKLEHATRLRTIPLGTSATLKVGAKVYAVGNAAGAGKPKLASGTITGLNRQITASDESGATETLTRMIATDAPVEPGDSGGPLYNALGRVIGITTAGNGSFTFSSGGDRGFAIPINKVKALAKSILTATTSSTRIHVGATAFLGVGIDPSADVGGAAVTQVISGQSAEAAGLQPGDVITSLDGRQVTSQTDLQAAVLQLKPGTAVAIEWLDQNGEPQTGTITPQSGPPQ
ncbi:MAG TPA: trypsin-like peptidase domain-containing protein [Gaiellaceae bacterium]|nr:trypsin-like peptidase domain-containing protein [Gaiellaceae bacterium]